MKNVIDSLVSLRFYKHFKGVKRYSVQVGSGQAPRQSGRSYARSPLGGHRATPSRPPVGRLCHGACASPPLTP